jgi:hypothetical protein
VLITMWMRSSVLVLVCSPTVLACTDTDSHNTAPATVIAAPEPEPEQQPPLGTEQTLEPEPLEVELLAVRDGPMDLLTTDDKLFVRIEGELLHVDDRGRPIYTPDARDPGWSWPPLHEQRFSDSIRAEGVRAFGGPADRPILSLSLHLARFESFYAVHRLGGSSVEQLKFKHRKVHGYYTDVASWGDQVVGLAGWEPDPDYYGWFYLDDWTDKESKAWDAAVRSLETAPQGIVLVSKPARGQEPDLLGLVPMALASDADGNLHAIAHTLPPDFDPVAVMEEHDPLYFAYRRPINAGILGGDVEQYTVHEYVHLRWRPGATKPERLPLPGLEQAQVKDVYLSTSAALTLAVHLDESRVWLGVLEEGERWRNLPSEGLPSDKELVVWAERSPDLSIDTRGQAWMRVDHGLLRLPSHATRWNYQPLPPAPITPPNADGSPQRRTLEVGHESELRTRELAWADGRLWLVAYVGSGEAQLLFRVIDGERGDTVAPVELPSSAEVYRRTYGVDPKPESADFL